MTHGGLPAIKLQKNTQVRYKVHTLVLSSTYGPFVIRRILYRIGRSVQLCYELR